MLFCVILLSTFAFISQTSATQLTDGILTEEIKEGTRLIISTSGPAKFDSYWLDEPPRLVIEFKSRNIISKIDKEIVVNQGVIEKITSSYFGRGRKHSLKSLTFELFKKVPYRIWQENNSILLEIQAPLESSASSVEGERVFAESETGDAIIKRLEAMDAALMQVAETQAPLKEEPLAEEVSFLQLPKLEQDLDEKALEEIDKSKVKVSELLVQDKPKPSPTEYSKKIQAEREAFSPKAEVLPVQKPNIVRKALVTMLFGFAVGLALILGIKLFVWYRHRSNVVQGLKKLRSELEEKDKLLKEKNKHIEHERIIRKTVEETSLQREKEYQNLKESLIKKGLLKRELSAEEREKPWIPGKSPERRQFSRLALSRDYNRTIILRVDSPNRPEVIKSFANNISFDGLSFETKDEFKKEDPINLRLFFYGDIVPMIKIQAHIVWHKGVEPINYYGVYFDLVEERDRLELNRYIDSKITESVRENV